MPSEVAFRYPKLIINLTPSTNRNLNVQRNHFLKAIDSIEVLSVSERDVVFVITMKCWTVGTYSGNMQSQKAASQISFLSEGCYFKIWNPNNHINIIQPFQNHEICKDLPPLLHTIFMSEVFQAEPFHIWLVPGVEIIWDI